MMSCLFPIVLFTIAQAILILGGQEDVPSHHDLAMAMQNELNQKITNDETAERCASILLYSMLGSPALTSKRDDAILSCARIDIDITRSQWDAARFSSETPDCILAAALALLEHDEFDDVLLLSASDVLTSQQRAQVLAQLSMATALKGRMHITKEAIISLRLLLEADSGIATEYEERTYLQAMIASAALGDELNCRWFCVRLNAENGARDLLPEYCADDLSGVVPTEAAFPVMVQIAKDLPAGKLREQFCIFLLFHDRNKSSGNKEAEHLLWLQSEPTVRCASICRKVFLGQPLTQDDTDFLIADSIRLRIVVNWIARSVSVKGIHNVPQGSVRQLQVIAEKSLPQHSATFWFIKSRLAAISVRTDPIFCRECLKDWFDTIKQGADADVVPASATQMMSVTTALLDVDSLRRILEIWREQRAGMENVERRICDAETLRILQALPNTFFIKEVPEDLCAAYPFAVGMIRPKDFQATRTAFNTSRERFWFTAGYLSMSLKEEGRISSFVVECCTATETVSVD